MLPQIAKSHTFYIYIYITSCNSYNRLFIILILPLILINKRLIFLFETKLNIVFLLPSIFVKNAKCVNV